MRNRMTGKSNFAQATTAPHVFSELQGQECLFSFSNQIGQKHSNDLFGPGVATLETVHCPFAGGVGCFLSNQSSSSEVASEMSDRTWIGHANREIQPMVNRLTGRTFVGGFTFDNVYASLPIEQSSQVIQWCCMYVHTVETTLVTLKKQANSVELPTAQASGQYRAKQGVNRLLGVCREHRLAPKGMMCSELRRNAKSAAEMPAPDIFQSVTRLL
jgi:hypothetical protein